MAKPPRPRPSEPRASARATKQRTPAHAKPRTKRLRVAVVTGTRAEFGLLRPVMDAIKARKDLQLLVVAGGAHMLAPARTITEVESAYRVAATVPMQRPGQTGRAADAAALGRGVSGFAKAFADLKPDWVVVLGDRIEALAAASAASVAGIAVCHIHGGDRAEGIADEAMRHAITKLAHLHCAATKLSASRILRMGERPEHVHVTGSPAIDGLSKIKPMSDAEAAELGDPDVLLLLHPCGLSPRYEQGFAEIAESTARHLSEARAPNCRTLWLAPNSDPGSSIVRQVRSEPAYWVTRLEHLERPCFIALLKRLARKPRGCLVGNSSAGLIECAAIGLPAVDIGPRQSGRERGSNVIRILTRPDWQDSLDGLLSVSPAVFRAASHVRSVKARRPDNRFGDGHSGPRIAALLAQTDPHAPALLRKRNAY